MKVLGSSGAAALVTLVLVAACGGTAIDGAAEPDDGAGGGGDAAAGGPGPGGAGPGGAAGAGGRLGAGGRSAPGAGGRFGSGGRVGAAGAGTGGLPVFGTGGATVDAGTGGAAADAGSGVPDSCVPPPIECLPCVTGYWSDFSGCPSCACAPPPLAFTVDGVAHPLSHVVLLGRTTMYIGGIDRYIFEFTWNYDDPSSDDEEARLDATVRVMVLADYIGQQAVTFRLPDPSPPTDIEGISATYTTFSGAAGGTPMQGVSGFLTVRREGDRFAGGVYLELEPDTAGSYPARVVAAGPLFAPVPAGH